MALNGKIALVTGASRGIGRGIALQLGEAKATVYVTGRLPKESTSATEADLPTLRETADVFLEITARGGKCIAVYVDHNNMAEVEQLFDKIEKESGTLDILVNNAYQAVQAISNNVSKRFYECDPEIWDEVNNVGLRNHYFCSVFAARIMVKNFSGLIVNISSAGGLTYFLNVPYGVGKCAVDRMAQDMAHELKGKGVTVVSLWPSLVKTELMDKLFKDEDKLRDLQNASGAISKISPETMKQNFNDNESTEFPGKAIVALASDSAVIRKTGRVLLTADLGDEYGFLDVDGGKPASIRSVSALLKLAGCTFLYPYLPRWIKVPGWVMTAFTSKL